MREEVVKLLEDSERAYVLRGDLSMVARARLRSVSSPVFLFRESRYSCTTLVMHLFIAVLFLVLHSIMRYIFSVL